MLRRIALVAALALATTGGIAHAEGGGDGGDTRNLEALRASPVATMSGVGARAVPAPGQRGRVEVVYDSNETRSLAHGGTPVLITDGNGSYTVVYR